MEKLVLHGKLGYDTKKAAGVCSARRTSIPGPVDFPSLAVLIHGEAMMLIPIEQKRKPNFP